MLALVLVFSKYYVFVRQIVTKLTMLSTWVLSQDNMSHIMTFYAWHCLNGNVKATETNIRCATYCAHGRTT